MDNLTRNVLEAQKRGMSYGQYMAWKREHGIDTPKPAPKPKHEPQLVKVGVCVVCGKDIMRENRKGKPNTCSQACAEERNRRTARQRYYELPAGKVRLKCPECGKEFLGKYGRKFCSEECRRAVNKRQTIERYHRLKSKTSDRECPWCKEEFTPKNGNQIYCCKFCQKRYNEAFGEFKEKNNG